MRSKLILLLLPLITGVASNMAHTLRQAVDVSQVEALPSCVVNISRCEKPWIVANPSDNVLNPAVANVRLSALHIMLLYKLAAIRGLGGMHHGKLHHSRRYCCEEVPGRHVWLFSSKPG